VGGGKGGREGGEREEGRGKGGREGQGEGGRNDPNIVCTYEYNKKRFQMNGRMNSAQLLQDTWAENLHSQVCAIFIRKFLKQQVRRLQADIYPHK
jgi:hypothetical protein